MDQVIDHSKPKIHLALGLSEAHEEAVSKILHDYFIVHTEEGDKRGHEKASISLVEVINFAKKKIFNTEGPIQEYEATLAYLAYLVGAEVAQNKLQQQMHRQQLANMIFGGGGGHPLAEILGGGNPDRGGKKSKAIIMKVDSQEEMELQQSVIENMAKGRFIQATNGLIRLQEIKKKGKKKSVKKGKTTRKSTPKK